MDAMLGRLARYARFVGCDTVYAPESWDDTEVARRAADDGRVLVTRDRRLAARVPGAVLLTSAHLEPQWRALRHAVPSLPHEVRFERCSLCNGRLRPYVRGTAVDRELALPPPNPAIDRTLHACERCGQLYWEGSHTATIRERLRRWAEPPP